MMTAEVLAVRVTTALKAASRVAEVRASPVAIAPAAAKAKLIAS